MTLEQERAANALERLNAVAEQEPTSGFRKRYRSYVERLGPAIVMNGLGQALATERATAGAEPSRKDDERAHLELYQSVQQWLCRGEGGVYPSDADLLQSLVREDEAHYLRAQAEALAWLDWHKKFCRATFPKGEGD